MATIRRGKYRWPIGWQVDFVHVGRSYRLTLNRRAQKHISHWETGGFAMSIVSGTIVARDGGENFNLVGWAELLN